MIVSGGWDTDGVPAGHALCEPGGEDCSQRGHAGEDEGVPDQSQEGQGSHKY